MSLFSLEGPLYKISKLIYTLLTLNFLCFIFSIPIITMGTSITALFYVTGKIIRGENYYLFKDFCKSFWLNLRQGIMIFLLFTAGFYLILVNIRSVNILGLSKIFIWLQYLILFELTAGIIVIFPLLARYHFKSWSGIKFAFFLVNRHLITAILAVAVLPALFGLVYWQPVFLLFIIAIYGFWINLLWQSKFVYHK